MPGPRAQVTVRSRHLWGCQTSRPLPAAEKQSSGWGSLGSPSLSQPAASSPSPARPDWDHSQQQQQQQHQPHYQSTTAWPRSPGSCGIGVVPAGGGGGGGGGDERCEVYPVWRERERVATQRQLHYCISRSGHLRARWSPQWGTVRRTRLCSQNTTYTTGACL